jgi:hypothetical protein
VASIWFNGSYHTTKNQTIGETTMGEDTPAALGALRVDEGKLNGHVDQVVRSSVEKTLNGLLDAEADEICRAQRYERSPDRADTRAGHYERKLETKAGEVRLRIPKLRSLPFETAIIERYRRREASVEEALVEMYLAGVSVRRVEDITEALWGTRVSSGTDAGRSETQAHRIDQMGQAALPRDGSAAQPRQAGGSCLKIRSRHHRVEEKAKESSHNPRRGANRGRRMRTLARHAAQVSRRDLNADSWRDGRRMRASETPDFLTS